MQQTVLVVADDLHILILAQTVLTGKGYMVLVASDAPHAIQILKQNLVPVEYVAIRAGMRGFQEVQDWSRRSGARPCTFRGTVDERRVRLEGLESGADWESALAVVH
jgi:DNA-binding response OmpR family regulator